MSFYGFNLHLSNSFFYITPQIKISSLCGMMEYLALKDQSDGVRVRRGTWEEDQEVRLELMERAKAMLLSFEKRRAKLSRTVSLSTCTYSYGFVIELFQAAQVHQDKLAKAERNYLRQKRLESGRKLSEEDLDPEFASSRLPSREVGTNLRSQLFALSKEPELCCVGLFKYLDLSNLCDFKIETAVAALATSPDYPLQNKLPVSLDLNHNGIVS